MINSRLSLILMVVLCVIQLAFVSNMISNQKRILNKGTEYHFKTRPIDPVDPFRGRYVRLNFEAERAFDIPIKDDPNFRQRKFYAILSVDSLGFADIDTISLTKPKSENYLITSGRISSSYYETREIDSTTVYLEFPFDRYYMEETKAPEADRILWGLDSDSIEHETYAIVSIWKGQPALKDIIIDSKSLNEIVETNKTAN